jgi:hypothetical protein
MALPSPGRPPEILSHLAAMSHLPTLHELGRHGRTTTPLSSPSPTFLPLQRETAWLGCKDGLAASPSLSCPYWERLHELGWRGSAGNYTTLLPQSHFLASTEGDCLAGLQGWTGGSLVRPFSLSCPYWERLHELGWHGSAGKSQQADRLTAFTFASLSLSCPHRERLHELGWH